MKSCEKVICWKINRKRGVDDKKLFESKRRGRLVVRLKAIKYYKRLLCYLSFYINLLISDLKLDPDLMLWPRPLIQRWSFAFIPYTSHLMLGCNYTHYDYLLLTLFEHLFSMLSSDLENILTFWLFPIKYERSKT